VRHPITSEEFLLDHRLLSPIGDRNFTESRLTVSAEREGQKNKKRNKRTDTMNSLKHAPIKPALLGLSLAVALLASNAWADEASAVRVQGGGIALFDADVPFDSDLEDRDGSAFAFNVIIGNDGSVKGDCQYVMAGRTDFDGLGPQVVHNPVTDAWVNLDGSVTLYSEGSLRTWKGQVFDVEMLVTVTAGGAGVGTIQVTFTIPAYGLFDAPFPVQTLASGQVTIR